jgi:hypothetical protein
MEFNEAQAMITATQRVAALRHPAASVANSLRFRVRASWVGLSRRAAP